MQNKQQFIKEKAKKMTTKTENMTTEFYLRMSFRGSFSNSFPPDVIMKLVTSPYSFM